MAGPVIRQIPREKLYAVFKSWELVQLFETLLQATGTSIPDEVATVQANLDAHISDTTAAHLATAISVTPAGGISSNQVQAALQELDTEKQPADAMLTALSALVTVADRGLYFTGADAPALFTLTAYARTLLDDPDAATALGTLGVASAVATWLATPSSANLRAAMSDESGTGALLFAGGNIGAATGTSLAVTGALTSSGTAGVGYAAGAGGTVTQTTSKATGVTLNKTAGEITMDGAALAGGASVTFTLTNSTIAATDLLLMNHAAAGTFGAYHLDARAAAGSADIVVRNLTGGSLSEAIVIRFAVIKASSS